MSAVKPKQIELPDFAQIIANLGDDGTLVQIVKQVVDNQGEIAKSQIHLQKWEVKKLYE